MKIFVYAFILFSFVNTCLSQVVITRNDTMPFGRYGYAINRQNLNTMFRLDTVGSNCVWDISKLDVESYDTIIVRSAREGRFGNDVPDAVYVSTTNKDTISESYTFCNDKGCFLRTAAYDLFCGKILLMEVDTVANIITFPWKLGSNSESVFIWKNPTCGNYDSTTGLFDSTYWQQKETAVITCMAEGIIKYNDDIQIPAILTRNLLNIHAKEYRTNNLDSGVWKITNEIKYDIINYTWLTHGKGYNIMYTRFWGDEILNELHFMPASYFTGITNNINKYNNLFNIYPNPVHEYLTYTIDASIENICIYDIRGQMIYSFEDDNKNIYVKHLPPGMYIFKAQGEDGKIYTTKFVKE
jgi:hypothetical protein